LKHDALQSGRHLFTISIVTNRAVSNAKQEYDSMSEINIIVFYLSIVCD